MLGKHQIFAAKLRKKLCLHYKGQLLKTVTSSLLIVTHMKLARVSLVQNGEYINVKASFTLNSSNVL